MRWQKVDWTLDQVPDGSFPTQFYPPQYFSRCVCIRLRRPHRSALNPEIHDMSRCVTLEPKTLNSRPVNPNPRPTLPQTNMETHIVPFRRTVVFTGPFFGFHVSFRECKPYLCWEALHPGAQRPPKRLQNPQNSGRVRVRN